MMVHRKTIVRLREAMRRTVRLLDWETSRDVEYGFAKRHLVGDGESVLDVGGCESLLNLRLARSGMKVTVYDYREYPEKHPNLKSVQGDFLKNTLPDYEFDYVTLISAIEHFGFGGYGDPPYDDGDLVAMAQVKRVVKPGGRIIVTFPFAGKHKIIPGFERWFDIARVRRLFEGMHVLAEEYYAPDKSVFGRWVNFAPVSFEQIKKVDLIGCQGCACYVVSPSPRHTF